MYDVRDLLGHWVKPRRREGQKCPHACCRNRRVHPDRFPVILDRELLRSASEEDLVHHLNRADVGHSDRAIAQITGEIDRRERVQRNRAARRDRAAGRRRSRHEDFRAHLEGEFVAAERETRGHMLNRAGQAAGVDPRSLFTGPEARARKYASEELRRYWDSHPRLTAAEFTGGGAAQRRAARGRAGSRLYGVY